MNINTIMEEFFANEPLTAGRWFAKYLSFKKGKAKEDFILAYSYGRWVDDVVDLGSNPEEIDSFLFRQRRNIEELIEGKSISTEDRYVQVLTYLGSHYGRQLLEVYLTMMSGFDLDNQIKREGLPLDRQTLDIRHSTQSLTGMQALSLTVFGKKLEYSERFEKLMIAWEKYDALRDFKEDLRSGLLLFSREDLESFGIELERGEIVPVKFQEFIYAKKRETMGDLFRLLDSVEDTNLPYFERKVLKLYYSTRPLKLFLTDSIVPEGLRYGLTNIC